MLAKEECFLRRNLSKDLDFDRLISFRYTTLIYTGDELIAFCKDNIASYKKLKSVDFVDELPKNNYGKILKRE